MNKIETLLRTDKNLFTSRDLCLYWNVGKNEVKNSMKHYLKSNRLISPYRGIYSFDNDYNIFELAQKIVPFSYISFYTALAYHGIIFQYYSNIHSASLVSKKIVTKKQAFLYHQIKEDTLFHPLGIIQEKNFLIAEKERAICDSLYLYRNLAFDNLKEVDMKKLKKTSLIYGNKRLEKEVLTLVKNYA